MTYPDIQRLRVLFDKSNERLSKAAAELNQLQLDGIVERKQYFEKLTIGSGAAIAAIVSFLGTHATSLQPPWILRCSLISLAIAMISALYRNFRHPYYLLSVRKRLWMEAAREQQQCKSDYLMAVPNAIDLHDGTFINKLQWQKGFVGSDAQLKSLIEEVVDEEKHLCKEWVFAERLCLGMICVAMISLVWLALRNF